MAHCCLMAACVHALQRPYHQHRREKDLCESDGILRKSRRTKNSHCRAHEKRKRPQESASFCAQKLYALRINCASYCACIEHVLSIHCADVVLVERKMLRSRLLPVAPYCVTY